MGRVFSTSFHYSGHAYTALIALTWQQGDLSINIQVPDTALHHLLPQGRLNYNSKEGLGPLGQPEKEQAQELVGCIFRTVEKHLLPASGSSAVRH
jgi:hypothetical protein